MSNPFSVCSLPHSRSPFLGQTVRPILGSRLPTPYLPRHNPPSLGAGVPELNIPPVALCGLELAKLAEEQLHLAQVRLAAEHRRRRAVDLWHAKIFRFYSPGTILTRYIPGNFRDMMNLASIP